jgi:hypothetical protein
MVFTVHIQKHRQFDSIDRTNLDTFAPQIVHKSVNLIHSAIFVARSSHTCKTFFKLNLYVVESPHHLFAKFSFFLCLLPTA